MMVLERLASEAYEDKYFRELYSKINNMYYENIFNKKRESILTDKEYIHILRFCDILSNSSDTKYRNIAYKIITLLYPYYKEDPYFKTVSTAVLSKLGNFPALQLLNYNVRLPLDREMEKDIKKTIQKLDDFNDVFLTDYQFLLYQKIKNSNVFSFSGPTSIGKSFMIKVIIAEQMKKINKPNIVVIVPTRALIHQFATEIKRDLNSMINEYQYVVLTNGNLEGMKTENLHFIMVLTPERLLSYLSEEHYPKIHCLFVDEAHKLANEHDKRSITLYTAIERTIYSNKDVQIFFASPNVTNPEVFLQLFNKNIEHVYYSNESPVSQQLFYIDLIQNTVIHYTDFESKEYPFVTSRYKNFDSLDTIYLLSQDQSNLIYCNYKRETVQKAMEFSRRYGINEMSPTDKQRIHESVQIIKKIVHPDYYLIDCLKRGVAYHFGSLPQVVRYNIESLFKDGVIKYLFCTSTLLEGVNLPAKNVFILQNKNGKRNFSTVDFWNLAGRAGRLRYELSGNIYCIREKKSDWNKIDKIIESKKSIHLKPTVSDKLEKKISQIEHVIKNKKLRHGSKTEKEIIQYLANIISIDTLEYLTGYKTPVIEKLIKNKQDHIIDLAKKRVCSIKIPKHILKTNQFISIEQQESAYQYVLRNASNPIKIIYPNKVNYRNCLSLLNRFHEIYKWEENEVRLKNKESLKYFAFLMNNWINGVSLNEIINKSISYYDENNKKISFYENGQNKWVDFDKTNRMHVNILINNLINEIEEVIRFTIQKYVNHYYLLLIEVLGKDYAGINWSNFLEYGTRSTAVIALQNMGLSRYVANLLINDYSSYFVFEDGNLIKVLKDELLDELEEGSIVKQEVLMFL
jgi:replicative superfamily II helicase